jgi:hypothetical protein
MSDERFTQTILRAPRVDQEQAIAFRTIIENVFSGSGSDDVFGNDADNEIHAGASDDLITGVQAIQTQLNFAVISLPAETPNL